MLALTPSVVLSSFPLHPNLSHHPCIVRLCCLFLEIPTFYHIFSLQHSFLNTLLLFPRPSLILQSTHISSSCYSVLAHHLIPFSAFHRLLSIQVLSPSSQEEACCDGNSDSTPSLLLPEEQTNLQTGCYIFTSPSQKVTANNTTFCVTLISYWEICGDVTQVSPNVIGVTGVGCAAWGNECESVPIVVHQERMTGWGNIVSHHQPYR